MRMTALWDSEPYILVEVDLRLRGVYCLNYQRDSHLHIYRRENLKSRFSNVLYCGTSQNISE
jgi:hypothetical protein